VLRINGTKNRVNVFASFASLLVYTFGVFLKPVAAEFGWSRPAISAAFGLAALGIAACSSPLGLLPDRFPARRIILPCLTVFGLAFASLSMLTHHLWHLNAVFLVLGIVGNGTAHLAYSRAISTWFHARRGVVFTVLMTGGAVGAMVLPPVAQALIHSAGWRDTFAILGVVVLAIGLPFALQVRECPSPARLRRSAGIDHFRSPKVTHTKNTICRWARKMIGDIIHAEGVRFAVPSSAPQARNLFSSGPTPVN
jgi:MFS family permease